MSQKLRITLERLSQPAFLAKLTEIHASLTTGEGLVNFPDPWPAVYLSRPQLGDALVNYRALYVAAADGSRAAIRARDQMRAEITAKLKSFAGYLEAIARAAGNPAMLLTTGYDVCAVPVRSQFAERLEGPVVTLKHGKLSGTLEANLQALPGAAAYEGEITAGNPLLEADFGQPVLSQRATHIEFTGLIPGQRYHVRFRGVGRAGRGKWSAVVSLIAL